MIYGSSVGGIGLERTYILEDQAGNELPAVMMENEVVFDATPNDIRLGKVAVNEQGVVTGEKDIPAYHTQEGISLIPVGSSAKIVINRYDYTKLQCLICLYNASMSNSVATEKVAINNSVYATGSTIAIASITLDHQNKAINLGIQNDGSVPYVLRYFTYKEEV